MIYSVLDLPKHERPRERLQRYGEETLASAELIAILLGSGTRTMPVLQLGQALLSHFGSLQKLAAASIEELCEVKGVGQAKALQLKAAFTLGARARSNDTPPKIKVEHPSQAYHYIREKLECKEQEHFAAIFLDARGNVITDEIISVGTVSEVLVHPREVFHPAIRHRASGMIVVHNHPSGELAPSNADIELTRDLIKTGELIGIPVQDHLIVTAQGYYSFRQHRLVF
jgi:DNA repair protein RadC